MSDHPEQGGEGKDDDLLSNQPKRPGRLDPKRLALWQQEQQTPLPRKDGNSKSPMLGLSRKGYDRESRVSLRKIANFELPPLPIVEQGIKEKLIDGNIQPSSKQQQPPKRFQLGLHRTKRTRNLKDMALQAFIGIRDDVLEKWKAFNESLDVAKTKKLSQLGDKGRVELQLELSEKLQATIDAAEKFLKLGAPSDDGSGKRPRDTRRRELKDLQEEVEPVVAAAKRLFPVIKGLFSDQGGPDDLDQAFEVKRRGIRFSDLELDTYGDDKLDRDNSKEDFAGGQVNKVSKLVYGQETRIFKSEQLTTNSKANLIGFFGIDRSAPRFGNRNIATKAMADVLGSNVIPDSCYTIHDGKIGLLMQQAPGEEMKDFKKKGFNPKPPPDELVASLHEQLNQLEWTDMLTGQGDRHDGNYMIDAQPDSVKITGIDNDFCFGKKQDDYNEYGSRPQDGESRGGRRGLYWGYHSAEMPPLIDQKVYDNLKAKDFDQHVRPQLQGLLTEDEIKASATRFKQMQDHALSLHPNYVVSSWKDWRSPQDAQPPGVNATEFLQANKSITLFQRDFANLV